MYSELKESFKKIDNRLDKLEEDQKKIEFKIENDISNKVKVLYDGREIVKDSLLPIKSKLNEIFDKVDKHDIKI